MRLRFYFFIDDTRLGAFLDGLSSVGHRGLSAGIAVYNPLVASMVDTYSI